MFSLRVKRVHGMPAAALALLLAGLGAAPARASVFRILRPHPAPVLLVRATTPMARCMATWDRSSQMSKRVWKQTCRRVVKNNPGLYNKPF